MNVRVLVLFPFFLFPLLAGCATPAFHPSDPVPSERSFGLGLQIPGQMPPRASLQDDPKEAAKLADFLRTQAPTFFAECKGPYDTNNTEKDLSRGQLLQAMFFLPMDCAQLHREDSERMARQAMENGTEQETFDRLVSASQRAMENASAKLAQIVPGSQVDAQVLFTLQAGIELNNAGIRTAAIYMAPYKDGSRHDLQQLDFVLGSLAVGPRYADAMMRVMERYPWTHAVCAAPDVEALALRVQAKFDEVLAVASLLGNPDDADNVGTMYGRLLQDFNQSIPFFAKRGWWPALLDIEARLDWQASYWLNYTANPLPTREEARYLLAEYRSRTNTLWTEYRVDGYDLRMEYSPHPWEDDNETGGIIALTLPALRSPFLNLVCGPTGQPPFP